MDQQPRARRGCTRHRGRPWAARHGPSDFRRIWRIRRQILAGTYDVDARLDAVIDCLWPVVTARQGRRRA
jgi:hypothetical protein